MSLPASYLLSMPVRIRELLPRLASVSLSYGDKTGERRVLVSILIQQLHYRVKSINLAHHIIQLKYRGRRKGND